MDSESIEKLLAAWQQAYWTFRVTGFGLGDVGTDYHLEEQIVEEKLPLFRAALQCDDLFAMGEIYRQLEDQNMLTEELEGLLISEPPPTEDLLYNSSDFQTSCIVIAPDFAQINAELLEYFASHPAALYELSWRQFERLLETIFSNHGYRTEIGPGSDDGGIDLRLLSKDSIGEVVTLVQAKRYAPTRPINLEAVSALYGVVESENANRGLFVTTSRYLPSAQRFAQRTRSRLILATADDVAQWCSLKGKREFRGAPNSGVATDGWRRR